jgi:hypothetical protein
MQSLWDTLPSDIQAKIQGMAAKMQYDEVVKEMKEKMREKVCYIFLRYKRTYEYEENVRCSEWREFLINEYHDDDDSDDDDDDYTFLNNRYDNITYDKLGESRRVEQECTKFLEGLGVEFLGDEDGDHILIDPDNPWDL